MAYDAATGTDVLFDTHLPTPGPGAELRVTTTERYTHVAALQMRDASDRMDQALWRRA
jgi:hypothetical protein